MQNSKNQRRKSNWIVKYSARLVVVITIILCAGWAYVSQDSKLPIKNDWTKQRSEFWFNWVRPCRYYRFQSQESASTIADWFVDRFHEVGSWNPYLITDSEKLRETIKSQFSARHDQVINQFVMDWSIPLLGQDFALKSIDPFMVIVHTKDEPFSTKRTVHIRIFDTPPYGAIIEVWDNKGVNL